MTTRSPVIRFALVSGTGLTIDFAIYTALCLAGMSAGAANLISAAVAVTFVYLVAGRHIFRATGRDMTRLFWAYVVWQAFAVPAASLAVELATDAFDGKYLLGKTVVLPFTFGANYLFTNWLLGDRRRATVPRLS